MDKIIKKNIPEEPVFPLPYYLEQKRNNISNFGMFFQKYSFYHFDKKKNTLKTQHNWNNGKKGRDREDYSWSIVDILQQKYKNIVNGNINELNKYIKRKQYEQYSYLKYLEKRNIQIIPLDYELKSDLITGIGLNSPYEIGMVFDHNSGLPYIPASTIKGAVRYSYCINYIRENELEDNTITEDKVDGLQTLFGSLNTNEGKKGDVVFLDSFPKKIPEITDDIITSHFPSYYDGRSYPVETETPNPVKFLKVKKGLIFQLNCYIKTESNEKYLNKLEDAIDIAFTEIGIGAKTASGYGNFLIPYN